MASLIDNLLEKLGPNVTNILSEKLGIGGDKAGGLLKSVIPMILGGLKRQSDNHGGADRVNHILDKYGQADQLDNVDSALGSALDADDDVDPDLGGLLGGQGESAAGAIASQLGIDADKARKIIPSLAPAILGGLSKARDESGEGINGLMGMLDKDGDGGILDDITGFLGGSDLGKLAGSVLGGASDAAEGAADAVGDAASDVSEGAQKAGGGLMSVLGKLFGKK